MLPQMCQADMSGKPKGHGSYTRILRRAIIQTLEQASCPSLTFGPMNLTADVSCYPCQLTLHHSDLQPPERVQVPTHDGIGCQAPSWAWYLGEKMARTHKADPTPLQEDGFHPRVQRKAEEAQTL